jgi:hypothetical protein
LLEREFLDDNRRPDLEISVFEVEEQLWCCVCLQKMASAGCDPPKYAGGVDMKPVCRDVEDAPMSYPFRLISERHRVFRLADEAGVLAFVRVLRAAIDDGRCRLFKHDRSGLRSWLHINREDPEWKAWLSAAPDKWQKFPQEQAAA